jgi:uncharacterized peroxidase-related enzyme
MPRISPVNDTNTPAASQPLLDGVQQKLGGVPNLLATLAHAPAALQTYLSLSDALSGASLSAGVREQIAVAVAAANSCDYCLAAHTAIGKSVKVSDAELASAQLGESSDPKTRAILTLARAIVDRRGFATDDELAAARAAGVTDAEILEIVATVVANIFTNYANHVIETEIDFPAVENRLAATA